MILLRRWGCCCWLAIDCLILLLLAGAVASLTTKRAAPVTRRMLQNRIQETDTVLEEWKPLRADAFSHLLDQQEYETPLQHPRMAASVLYAQSILNAWKDEEASWSDAIEWSSIVYQDVADDGSQPQKLPLYGYMVRNPAYSAVAEDDAPVILLFPTAVGAQDVFLLYQAAQLVQTDRLQHCRVVVVDLFSDPSGWLWDKVTYGERYQRMRDELLRHATLPTGEPCRPVLQRRIRSVLSYLQSTHVAAPNAASIAALGWCLGGHCIAEMARMDSVVVRAMVTFHGVFSGLQRPDLPNTEDDEEQDAWKELEAPRRPRRSEVLICHGMQDPFVPSNDLEQALALFQFYGHTTSLLQLDARHGFTNPAQVHNDNPAFGYSPESAQKAWRQALALLVRTIGRDNAK